MGPALTDLVISCPITPDQAPETYRHTSTVTDTFGNVGTYHHDLVVT